MSAIMVILSVSIVCGSAIQSRLAGWIASLARCAGMSRSWGLAAVVGIGAPSRPGVEGTAGTVHSLLVRDYRIS